ncbi:MAG: Panacea domain-containing protein [Candidatus Moraniibacteriota bacterium]
MSNLLETSYKKAVQTLNYLAEKKDGKINKMKAIKLIYFADRLHLRKYGRPIVGDMYWAMKLGPVGSYTKRVAELDVPENILDYAKKYIKPVDEKKQSFVSLKPTDTDVFSKTDIECLESVYSTFGDKDQFELAELSHEYPEWKKHEKELKAGKKRVSMNYNDFFAEAEKADILFGQKKSDLSFAKESFGELQEVSAFFAR